MIDLSKPRYDQSTYWGRLKHFSQVTDPRTLLASNAELIAAQQLIQDYKAGLAGVVNVPQEQLWKAKQCIKSY